MANSFIKTIFLRLKPLFTSNKTQQYSSSDEKHGDTTKMSPSTSAPPFDPALVPFFDIVPPADVPPSGIPALREVQNASGTLEGTLTANPGFTQHERIAKGPHGDVPVSIFTPETTSTTTAQVNTSNSKRPAIFFIHAGGFICGNRYTLLNDPLRWAKESNALLATVEYRSAPEHPFPVPHDDCWAALVWLFDNAANLGVDSDRILVAGMSAGGNLAASVALRARDEGEKRGLRIAGLVMDTAMLDDREYKAVGHSHNQFANYGSWNLRSNIMAWDAYLSPPQSVAELQTPSKKSKRGAKKGVSSLAVPSRAEHLRGLPPTYISVGSAEIFRDENIEFAKRMYEDGGEVEMHVWHGGFHCFDSLMPDVEVSKRSIEARAKWVKGTLERGSVRKEEKAKL